MYKEHSDWLFLIFNNFVTFVRKYTLADDSANIKDIKERFLPGGDLYEDGIMLKDGYFRKRKFAHVGSETSLDLFADDRVLDSGDEQFNDENSQAEAMRRKQRLEKEEFLSQMRVSTGRNTLIVRTD